MFHLMFYFLLINSIDISITHVEIKSETCARLVNIKNIMPHMYTLSAYPIIKNICYPECDDESHTHINSIISC
jgi:hypothetical protein